MNDPKGTGGVATLLEEALDRNDSEERVAHLLLKADWHYGAYAGRRRGWWRRRGVVLAGAEATLGRTAAAGARRNVCPS